MHLSYVYVLSCVWAQLDHFKTDGSYIETIWEFDELSPQSCLVHTPQNMLCFCIAYLLDIGMVHILKPTYPEELTIILNYRVYAAAYLFGAFMTFVVTWIALYRLKKQKLVELFERVS